MDTARHLFVIEALAGDPLTDNERLAVLCDRFRIVDPATGEALWEPRAGAEPEELRARIDRWTVGVRRVEVDPADPLSYLLIQCVCQPRTVVNCPVHGPRRLGRHLYVYGARHARAVARRREVADLVASVGSVTAAARQLGLSYQRVQQLLKAKQRDDAARKETR